MKHKNYFKHFSKFFRLTFLFAFVLFLFSFQLAAQTPAEINIKTENLIGKDYSISLEPLTIAGFDGLQSYAFGQFDGKWILIGGRTDGLHRRQPFAAFAPAGNNTNIFVIDAEAKKVWTSSVNELPAALSEQLQSSNAEFIQTGSTLYFIGGYGYSKTANNHITHDKLTAVKLDCLVPKIQKSENISACFRQISNPLFAVAGGQIGRLNGVYYLVGGQKFTGRYNPHGPDHGPGFLQEYTNQIRKFRINDDGNSLKIEPLESVTDEVNLHRRDLNMLPQIFPNNREGFTVFSGVFQKDADLPFLDTVDIFADKYAVNKNFSQFLNHYHSAKVTFYDAQNQRTENVFFGGIAQYEEKAGAFVKNDDVPFVKTIGKITREKDGKMTETKIGEMPAFLGASAELILNPQIPKYENDIVKINEIKGEKVLLGYIFGGITSPQSVIFFGNMPAQSDASSTVYKVWLTKNAK